MVGRLMRNGRAVGFFLTLPWGCGPRLDAPGRELSRAPARPSTLWSEAAPSPKPFERARLTSIAPETGIFSRPDPSGEQRGYLRAGAIVARSEEPRGRKGCRGGWYAIEPRGFVCLDRGASLDVNHPIAVAARYTMVGDTPPVLYVRLPTLAEQRLREVLERPRSAANDGDARSPLPPWLIEGRALPSLSGFVRSHGPLDLGEALPRTGFALLTSFDWTGRAFGLTTELSIVPLDRTRPATPSAFHGVELEGDASLPFVFTRKRSTRSYRVLGNGELETVDPIGPRSGLAVDEAQVCTKGRCFYRVRGGDLVDVREVVRAERAAPPDDLRPGERWIDVSLSTQILVAYEGSQAQYATLVSSGAAGNGEAGSAHPTIVGTFRIHTKHVSVTMGGKEPTDTFEFQDVPWVQYFKGSYALHAAFWHDDFGSTKSHGCINLAPRDAKWLFDWTAPSVPPTWHGAISRLGTLVVVHD